ncbi:unnamed protein product, partial [Candidula unifasciata]
PLTPSDRSEEDTKDVSGKRSSKVKDTLPTTDLEKLDKERQREQERLRQEKEVEEKASKGTAHGPEESEDLDVEEEKKEEVGVPNIIIDCATRTCVKQLSSVKSEVLPAGTQ